MTWLDAGTCAAMALQPSKAPALCCSGGRPLNELPQTGVVLFNVPGVMNDLWAPQGEFDTSLVDTEQTSCALRAHRPRRKCATSLLAAAAKPC